MKSKFGFILLMVIYGSFSIASTKNNCHPRIETGVIPAEVATNSNYIRVHPSGDYIFVTDTEASPGSFGKLIDISQRDASGNILPRLIETPLQLEAYPVLPDWEYMVSPREHESGNVGMASTGLDFYKFDDILQMKKSAQPVLSDDFFGGLYYSGSYYTNSVGQRTIRNLSDGGEFREYLPNKGSYSAGPIHKICSVPTKDQSIALAALTKELARLFDVLATENRHKDQENTLNSAETVAISISQITKSSFFLSEPSRPVLLPDGEHFYVSQDQAGHIYKINSDSSCRKVETFENSGKPNFSAPEPGKKGLITYHADHDYFNEESGESYSTSFGKIVVRDRDSGKEVVIPIDESFDPSMVSLSFPGFTADNRVVYLESVFNEHRQAEERIIIRDVNPELGRPCAQKSKITPKPQNPNKGSTGR